MMRLHRIPRGTILNGGSIAPTSTRYTTTIINMTSGARGTLVRRQAAANQSIVAGIWRWLRNAFWKLVFGRNEWDRICGPMTGSVDEVERMVQFRTSLALSGALVSTCNAVFDFEAFDAEVVTKEFIRTARVNEDKFTVVTNVRSCLQRFNFVNQAYARILALKDENYDSNNARHEAMLEELWSTLKPGIRRTGGRITKEWGEIGFQGTDPMSDFRGMGILSLVQLQYFASKCPIEAQRALVESNHPTRWYPFSVTGINITGFMIDLVQERLLDVKLYRLSDVSGSVREESLVAGVHGLHEFYCDVFMRFNKLWVDSNPRDVMAFPAIFQSLKDTIRRELTEKSFAY